MGRYRLTRERRELILKTIKENPELTKKVHIRKHLENNALFDKLSERRFNEVIGISLMPEDEASKKDEYHIVSGRSTLRDAKGNMVMEWTKTALDKQRQLDAMVIVVEEMAKKIEPTEPVKRMAVPTKENLCNQYTLTDYHLGMLAWAEETGDAYNMEIAEKLLMDWFAQAIESSPNAEQAIFANIGDFMHWDGMDAVTPQSKHILDADTRFANLVRTAIRIIRTIAAMLLEKYPKVHMIMAEGNHDMASSVWLRELFSAFYDNEPRLVVDTNPDPYYNFVWGKVCLFYAHGHLKKMAGIDALFIAKLGNQNMRTVTWGTSITQWFKKVV